MLDTEEILNELNDWETELLDREDSVEIFCNSWDAYDLGADQACDENAWPSPTQEIEKIVAPVVECAKECSICMMELQKCATIIECNHEFCQGCLKRWSTTHNTCPLCRLQYKSYLLSNGKTRKVKIYRPPPSSEESAEESDVDVITRPARNRQRSGVSLCTVCRNRMNTRLALECGLCFNKFHSRCLAVGLSTTLGCPVCMCCADAD